MSVDDKFEGALKDVANSVQGLAANGAGAPASGDAGELHSKMEGKFAENVKAIADQITALNKVLQENQQKLEKVDKEVKDVTVKIEVDRCMSDMLAWTAEDLFNKQVVENLNKVARKVNKLGEKVYALQGGD